MVKKDNKTQEVESKQLLAIKENDITLITDIQDFEQAIVKQNISQTFVMTDKNTKDSEQFTESFINEISTGDNEPANLELAKDLGFLDKKEIPNQEQTKELYSILNTDSILFDLE